MPTVKVNTKFRSIIKDSDVVITAPSFLFKNTGECVVFINNMPLLPGEWLGDSVDNAPTLMLKNVKIVRDETYKIAFKNYSDTGYSTAEVTGGVQLRKTLFIVETFYNLEK